MPRLGGDDLAQALMYEGIEVPILVVSGDRTARDVAAWGYTPYGFLPKPYGRAELYGALDALLERDPAEAAEPPQDGPRAISH